MTFDDVRGDITAAIQAGWTLTPIEWPNRPIQEDVSDYISVRIDDLSKERVGFGVRLIPGNLIVRFYTKPGEGASVLTQRADAMDMLLRGSTLSRVQFLDAQTNEDGVGAQRYSAVLLYVLPFRSTEQET